MKPKFRWDDLNKRLLTSLVANRHSAAQIARELGKGFEAPPTRNSVIGKAHRMGLQLGGASRYTPGAAVPKPAGKPRAATRKTQPRPPAVQAAAGFNHPFDPQKSEAAAAVGQAVVASMAEVETPGAVGLLGLEPGLCKWPIGDPQADGFSFCGRGGSTGPYCAEHGRVAYLPGASAATKARRVDRAVAHAEYVLHRLRH